MMDNTIFQLKTNYQFLQDQMESDPENENFEMLKDTLDSITDEFEVKAENTGYVIKNLDAKAKAKREVAKQLISEAQLLEKRSYYLATLIGDGMQTMGLKKIEGIVNTFRFNTSKRLEITNPDEVPIELCKIEPNKTKIAELMKTAKLDYAQYVPSQNIGLQGVKFSETAKKTVKK